MLTLTVPQVVTWLIIVGGGLVLVLVGIRKSQERLGGQWTTLIVLAVAVAIASAIVFPLHHGDGRSTSYNDGWD